MEQQNIGYRICQIFIHGEQAVGSFDINKSQTSHSSVSGQPPYFLWCLLREYQLIFICVCLGEQFS